VSRYWAAGLIPIGIGIMCVSGWSMLRRRTLASALLPATLVLGTLAGIHDHLIAWDLDAMAGIPAGWASQRIFLLHHAANLVLVALGGMLAIRFVEALSAQEILTRTLEQRVAQKEQELASNYVRLFALERENAASQERQRIMRDIHDGLGSQLFISLSRVERGEMDTGEISAALRSCIGELRLALDTLSPQNQDFRSVLGNFLFRWERHARDLGVRLTWAIDVPDEELRLSAHASLQLLRVGQEALTNALKHANASHVHVVLTRSDKQLTLELRDDGPRGAAPVTGTGHGLRNMRSRAEQLGGTLEVSGEADGTRVALHVPLQAVQG
jgi:signal transduction histidine kinase